MVRTLTTKEIMTNIAVEKVTTETKLVNILFLKLEMEKWDELLNKLFLKYVIEI